MTRELRFVVVGVALPQGSMRAFVVRRKRDGKHIATTTSDNPNVKTWRQTIADAASRELQAAHNRGLYFTGPVEFDVTFYLPRPAKMLTRKYAGDATPHLTRPDLDKLLRAAGDALKRIAWGDDSQITDLTGRKRYCAIGEYPRAEIAVRDAAGTIRASLPPPATPSLFGTAATLDAVGAVGTCKVTTEGRQGG